MPRLVEDGQHFVFAHDEVGLAVQLDLAAGVLAEQDALAAFEFQRRKAALRGGGVEVAVAGRTFARLLSASAMLVEVADLVPAAISP